MIANNINKLKSDKQKEDWNKCNVAIREFNNLMSREVLGTSNYAGVDISNFISKSETERRKFITKLELEINNVISTILR